MVYAMMHMAVASVKSAATLFALKDHHVPANSVNITQNVPARSLYAVTMCVSSDQIVSDKTVQRIPIVTLVKNAVRRNASLAIIAAKDPSVRTCLVSLFLL